VFRDREDAGLQLAHRLACRPLHDPLVLAIPRGGVVVGAALAHALGADLDVVLTHNLCDPDDRALALGAIAETGQLHLNRRGEEVADDLEEYLVEEGRYQTAELARRKHFYRGGRPAARIEDRSVVVVDDGLATGATMIAALKAVRDRHPREVIVAVPVLASAELEAVGRWCDEVVHVLAPRWIPAIDQVYEAFPLVEDETVAELIRPFLSAAACETGGTPAAP
jgi:predicted phosphoribosyltransferase